MKNSLLASLVFTMTALATGTAFAGTTGTSTAADEDVQKLSLVGASIRALQVGKTDLKYGGFINVEEEKNRQHAEAILNEFTTRANELGPRMTDLSPADKNTFGREMWWAATTPYTLAGTDTKKLTPRTVIQINCKTPANIVLSLQKIAEQHLHQLKLDYLYVQKNSTFDGPDDTTRRIVLSDHTTGTYVHSLGQQIRTLMKVSLILTETQKNKFANLVTLIGKDNYGSGNFLSYLEYHALEKNEIADFPSQILMETCE